MISSQIKSNCLTIHGFNPLKPISQSMVFEKTLPKAPNNYAIRFHTGHKHNENTPYRIKNRLSPPSFLRGFMGAARGVVGASSALLRADLS